MTIGEKIKAARKEKGMTQSSLCAEKITRNMLSEIECGKATPSLDTLKHIATGLDVDVAYLLSDDDSPLYYRKKTAIKRIKALLLEKKYKEAIEIISTLGEPDDELAYILSLAHFELGRAYVSGGSLESAAKHLASAIECSKKTFYDTERIRHLSLLYSAIAKNVKAPLLELDVKAFERNIKKDFEYDLFKYISASENHPYNNPLYAKHTEARRLMKNRKYKDALACLREIEEKKTRDNFNAYAILTVYSDMEACFKELADFENAYKYASKQLTLIEAFKS